MDKKTANAIDYVRQSIISHIDKLESRVAELERKAQPQIYSWAHTGECPEGCTCDRARMLKPSSSGCEHELEDITTNYGVLSVRLKFCRKCRNVIDTFEKPSPSRDTVEIDRAIAIEWMEYDRYDRLDEVEKKLYDSIRQSLGTKEESHGR